MVVKTLEAFTDKEKNIATDILSAKVSTMLGRKMECSGIVNLAT